MEYETKNNGLYPAAALGITGVSFPTAAKTVYCRKKCKKYNCKT